MEERNTNTHTQLKNTKKRNQRLGYLALTGCTLITIALGEFNLLPHLYPYLTSHFHSKDPKINHSHMKYISILYLISQAASMPLNFIIFNKLGYRKLFLLSIVVFSFTQYVSSFIDNYWFFLIFFSLLAGFAKGGYVFPLYCVWRYFPGDFKPFLSGVVLSSHALAAIPSSFLALWVINPDNKRPFLVDGEEVFEAGVVQNVPVFLRFFAILVLFLGVIGVFLIKDPISEEYDGVLGGEEMKSSILGVFEKSHLSDESSDITQNLDNSDITQNLENKVDNKVNFGKTIVKKLTREDFKIFKNKDFQKIYLTMLINFSYPLFVFFTYKKIALKNGRSDREITTTGMISCLFNAFGRIISGVCLKKFGYKKVIFVLIFGQILSSLTFCLSTKFLGLYAVQICLFFFIFGGFLGVYPLVSDVLFKDLGAFSYSMLYSSFTISNAFILTFADFFQKFTKNWEIFYFFLTFLVALPLIWVGKIERMMDRAKGV